MRWPRISGSRGDITTEATIPPARAPPASSRHARPARIAGAAARRSRPSRRSIPSSSSRRSSTTASASLQVRRHRARFRRRARAADGRARRAQLPRPHERHRHAHRAAMSMRSPERRRASSTRARRRRACAHWRSLPCAAAVASTIAFGLFDAVLIKDNHIVAAGGIGAGARSARARTPVTWSKIEIEVTTLDELDDALQHKLRRGPAR